jgi:FKBP-type peptidyl-prolyl cis-trans isomerase
MARLAGRAPSGHRAAAPGDPIGWGLPETSQAPDNGTQTVRFAMRRASALIVIPVLAALAAAGCSSSSSSSTPPPAPSAATNQSVTVSGAFGVSPKVVVPAAAPGANLYTKTVIKGVGKPLTAKESLVGNFVLYDWSGKTHKLVGSTFTSGQGPTLFSGQMLPGLTTALEGQPVGSRVVAVIPPNKGYGPQGNSQIGVKGTDTLVFVIDMISSVANTAAASGTTVSSGGGSLATVTQPVGKPASIKIPAANPPKALTVTTLIKGTGAKVAKGDYIVVQYTGAVWKKGATPKPFDSSWSRSAPFAFSVGGGQTIKGWDQGLVGPTVGSRVMLTIPPALAYPQGAPQAGIKATDSLVFVVDILGAYTPAAKAPAGK